MDFAIIPEEIRRRITPEMTAAAKLYLEKTQKAEKIRSTIRPEMLKIILANGFCYGALEEEKAGKPITKAEDDWLMATADFEKYRVECEKMYARLGYPVEKDNCPILIADKAVRNATENLVKTCEPVLLGMTWDALFRKPDQLNAVIELLLKLLIP